MLTYFNSNLSVFYPKGSLLHCVLDVSQLDIVRYVGGHLKEGRGEVRQPGDLVLGIQGHEVRRRGDWTLADLAGTLATSAEEKKKRVISPRLYLYWNTISNRHTKPPPKCSIFLSSSALKGHGLCPIRTNKRLRFHHIYHSKMFHSYCFATGKMDIMAESLIWILS